MSVVLPDEGVWRSAIFPLAFNRRQKFIPKSYYRLKGAEGSAFVLVTSLCRQKYAPTLIMVHRFGCRLAKSHNRSEVRRGKEANRIYCGGYALLTKDILGLKGTSNLPQVKDVQVIHCVENGEFAHANLRIVIDTNGDEEAVEGVKTLIVDRLWAHSSGPAKYSCLSDERLEPHPSEWLMQGGKGAFSEERSNKTIAADVAAYLLIYFPKIFVGEAFKWLKKVFLG